MLVVYLRSSVVSVKHTVEIKGSHNITILHIMSYFVCINIRTAHKIRRIKEHMLLSVVVVHSIHDLQW